MSQDDDLEDPGDAMDSPQPAGVTQRRDASAPAAHEPDASDDNAFDRRSDDDKGDDKESKRQGFLQRQLERQLRELRAENEGYKRRDEEARKAKLTEDERIKEELDSAKTELERLRGERLKERIAREFKLPDSFVNRLIGTDEEALRADAEDLAKLLPRQRVGTSNEPLRERGNGAPTFKRSQLRDPAFYKANRDAIIAAQREGRIADD